MIGVQNQSYEGASMSKFPKNLKIDPPFELVVNSLRGSHISFADRHKAVLPEKQGH